MFYINEMEILVSLKREKKFIFRDNNQEGWARCSKIKENILEKYVHLKRNLPRTLLRMVEVEL